MDSPSAWVAGLWTVWLLGWVLSARGTARTVVEQSAASRLAHGIFVWVGGLLLFSPPRRLERLQLALKPDAEWIAWLGVAAVVVGLGYSVWARIHLGRFWSGSVTLKAEHALIRTGPYAHTRHPIYTGLLAALAGTVIERRTLAALVGFSVILIGILIKIGQEERLMVEHFGEAYREYRARVPALVPRA